MHDFVVRRPSRIIFCAGCSKTHALAELQPFERVVVIGSERALGLPSSGALIGSLGRKVVTRLTRVVEHVPEDLVEALAAQVAPHSPDCLLVIGGGSAIGLAKGLVASMCPSQPHPRIVSIPTTYSGSEVTGIFGVSRTEADGRTVVKRGGRDERVRPSLVLYDSTLLGTLPLTQAIPSLFNALAHAVEALWAPACAPLSRLGALESIHTIFTNLPRLKADPSDPEAVDQLLYGAYLAGQALDNEEMALQHRLAHVLGGRFHLPHARTHMVILPHVIAYNHSALPGDLAARLRTCDVAGAFFDLMTELLGEAPSLASLGFQASDVGGAVDGVLAACTTNPIPLQREGLTALLERALSGHRPVPPPCSASDLPLPVLPSLPLATPRVPYLDDSQFVAKSPAAAATILERREGRLLHLDRVLMHAPAVAQGWNSLFGALRGSLALNGRLRELAILRVAVLNRAYYEYFQHHPVFLKEGGTTEQARWLGRWQAAPAGLYGEREQAVLQYVDEMTKGVQVSDQTARRVSKALGGSAEQVVEVTAVTAGYNMVSRFLEALDLTPETQHGLPPMPALDLADYS